MGLKPEHHSELNGISLESTRYQRQRFSELRKAYVGDSEALREIDKYDPRSSFTRHTESWKNAIVNGDDDTFQKEERWLKGHGYLQ